MASPTPESREGFARHFGFNEAIPPDEIWERDDLNALYILGPNQTHTPQLLKAAAIPSIQRIYIEKPIGISSKEVQALDALDKREHGKFILIGFQFLHKIPPATCPCPLAQRRFWQTHPFPRGVPAQQLS